MNDIEQSNKKHLNPKSGRKARENNKIKLDETNKVDYHDSRGQSFIKKKKNVDKVNSKAFAVQNVMKAKKKVAVVVDRQTIKHTFNTLSEQYLGAPQLISIVGPQGSGKSTLLRTLMRHYTNHRITVAGPVTVVTSKKKKVTFFECPNDLHSQIDIAKTSDMVLMMINVKEGIQTETFEFIELLHPHGIPRIKLIFTHIDKFPKNDIKVQKKIKMIIKRIQTEIHALPFRLTGIKEFRTDKQSEYKIEEVKNLARLIGQKNPLPNEWRSNHPYIMVDRLEKVTKERLDPKENLDEIKFYGYVRGCAMSADITRMHLMGVDDLMVDSVEPLNDPCPTPYQESKLPKKRQPLEMKERRAYAPMCGFGGVLKDSDGFHIISEKISKSTSDRLDHKNRNSSDENSDDEQDNKQIKCSLITEETDDSDEEQSTEADEDDIESDVETNAKGGLKRLLSSDSGSESPPSKKKKRLNSEKENSKNLVQGFEDLQDEFQQDNNRINYERLIYDEDYVYNSSYLENTQNDDKQLSVDLFVTGKWNADEDATTLLKKDDENQKKLKSRKLSDIQNDENDMEDDEYNDEDDEEVDDIEDEDNEVDDDMSDLDNNEMEVDDQYEIDSELDDDDDEDDDDDDDDNEEDDDDDDEDSKIEDTTEDIKTDEVQLTEFQKKKLERQSKTKREKKLEKKAKHKALFDKLYDQKQGDSGGQNFFQKWQESHKEQEEKNKVAFEHLDTEDAYKITGLVPGTYVCVMIKKIPKLFFDNFTTKRPVILGGLAPGEDTSAMLTASFKISRHYNAKDVLKTEDPVCLSIGWRRIQPFCYFFKEEHNLRKTYLKYSLKKGMHCNMAFLAPVVPVKTGFSAFINFENNKDFRLVGLGSVLTKDDSVEIQKKLKRKGEPVKIFKQTAFIKGMFSSDLEVMEYSQSQLRTTSGIRGAIKKPLRDDMFGPGAFRATFEAQIFMSDIVNMVCWVSVPIMKICQTVSNLLVKNGEVFTYFKLWNDYYRDNNIPLPDRNRDSEFKPVNRQPFNPEPIKFSRKVIEKLPFINRPIKDTPEDMFQKNRPKVVLDAKESQKAQLVDLLNYTKEERRKKIVLDKQRYGVVKREKDKKAEEKEQLKKKKKNKAFFKMQSIKSGEVKRKRKVAE